MKLVKRIMDVLKVTFTGDYASRAGVSFRRGTNASVMVGSTDYNNVYGIITDKLSDADMKSIANNIANIKHIGKLISAEMKKYSVRPHGRWFVTAYTVRTQVKVVVKGKYVIYNAVYSSSTGEQIGKLKLLSTSEVKPASIPTLRFKNDSTKKVVKRQEAAKAASPQFDMVRFHKYIDLVANFRPTYADVVQLKTAKIVTTNLDLDDPLKIITGLVHRARLINKRKYKSSNEEEAMLIIKKVNKMKESASAGSSLPKNKTNKGEKK